MLMVVLREDIPVVLCRVSTGAVSAIPAESKKTKMIQPLGDVMVLYYSYVRTYIMQGNRAFIVTFVFLYHR